MKYPCFLKIKVDSSLTYSNREMKYEKEQQSCLMV